MDDSCKGCEEGRGYALRKEVRGRRTVVSGHPSEIRFARHFREFHPGTIFRTYKAQIKYLTPQRTQREDRFSFLLRGQKGKKLTLSGHLND